jgi:hypothetical protein
MIADELVRQIKGNEKYWSGLALTPEQVDTLTNLVVDEYAKVVTTLLQESVVDYKNLRGIEYQRTYAHLIYGVFLSCLRPNPNLYPVILMGAIGIGDPSSIQYGAAALQQIKPTEQIALDLFAIAERHKDNAEILSHIAWLFYWLGFSEKGTWGVRSIILSLNDGWEKLYRENMKPETNRQETAKMAHKAGKFMKAHYKTV